MPASDFNPHSPDSMFSKIIERLNAQDRTTDAHHAENKTIIAAILEQTKLTNGRVTKLESARTYQLGWMAGASALGALIGAAATLVIHLL